MNEASPRSALANGAPAPGSPAGRRDLATAAAIAVLGTDRADVARAARETAEQQAAERPVVLIDLVGTPAGGEGAEGIYDVVEFGLSLARVAQPLQPSSRVRLVPPGTCTPLDDAVLAHPRWASLVRKARHDGALLVVAAPSDAPSLPRLLAQLDALVLVGDVAAPEGAPPVLHRLRARARPRPSPRPPAGTATPPSRVDRRAARRRRGAAIAALALAAVAIAAWRFREAWLPRSADDTPVASAASTAMTERAARGEVVAPEVGGWAVELESVNSAASAMLVIRRSLTAFPAPTWVPDDGEPSRGGWYRVIAGAYPTRAEAESLVVALRDSGLLLPGAGTVLHAPFAWQLDDGDLPPVVAVERVAAWRQDGVPAYPLEQPDGTMRLYVGAWETEDAARRFAPVLDSLHIHATLVTRVGSNR